MFLRKPRDCIHGGITTWVTLETRTHSVYKPNYPEKTSPTYLQEHNCISWGILNLSRIIRLNKKDGASSLLKYREVSLHSTSSHLQKDQANKQKSIPFILRYYSNKIFTLTQRCYAFGKALYAKSIKTILSRDCPKIPSRPLSSTDNWVNERTSP